jgi:hypothetical protein
MYLLIVEIGVPFAGLHEAELLIGCFALIFKTKILSKCRSIDNVLFAKY